MGLEGKEKVMRKYADRADKFVRAVGLETGRRLADKTPVDTGRARNNWHLATGSPATDNLPEGDYPRSGSLSVLRIERQSHGVEAGDTLFVTNALPYIPALEDGHSTQAPSGMIGVTVAELRAWLPGAVRELRRGD